MASPFVEKLKVAAVTATLVSAGWIVAGAVLLGREDDAQPQPEIAAQTDDEIASSGQVETDEDSSPDTSETSDLPSAELTAAGLAIPVSGVSADELIDSYLDVRGGGARQHQGIDIMAEEGTAVIAAAPGMVERIFQSDAGGNTVYVRSTDRRTIYYYAHLAEYDAQLSEGMEVRRGQRLGTVGSSGNADPTAPHLHFEIMRTSPEAEWYEESTSVNPYPILTAQR
ncbi:M23 family metallopeptidase [Aurantiacibacter sediminis]|uniref:M23 family metallopeptidase n=1 Tax=Aurantiacibacter sediminis TaxID=2793064 RepID=A0ABS0N4N3_9SPHN|nr:peptidoglycan DD-metalloendopeptidase family protein [Aurantiacibacter sediminis]MBH5322481.1 M23 family metallopeptidase [Aurantiacibacter sediminis]